MPIIDSLYVLSVIHIHQLSPLRALASQYMQSTGTNITYKLLAGAWLHTLTIGCNLCFKMSLFAVGDFSQSQGASLEWHHRFLSL